MTLTREQMIEALTELAEAAIDNVHDIDVTHADYARAAATAAFDAMSHKPLVWLGSGISLVTDCGKYRTQETPGRPEYCRLLYAKFGTTYLGDFGGTNYEERAQAAAEAHHQQTAWAAMPLADMIGE